MLKIRRPLGRLIFNMGIAIPGKTVFLIETTPWFPCTNSWAIECLMWVSMRTFIMLSRDSIILLWCSWRLLELMTSCVCAFILYIKPRHADSILWSYSISKILSSIQLYLILVWLFYTWFIYIFCVGMYVLFMYCIFYSVRGHHGRTVWLNGPPSMNMFEIKYRNKKNNAVVDLVKTCDKTHEKSWSGPFCIHWVMYIAFPECRDLRCVEVKKQYIVGIALSIIVGFSYAIYH